MSRGPVAIIGDGQMALVLANLLAEKQVGAVVWSPIEADAVALASTRRSRRMPGMALAPSVPVTAEPAAVRGASTILDAIPTQFIRSVWTRLKPHVERGIPVLSVSKGVEEETFLTPLQVIADSLGERPDLSSRPMVCVSGPTIAAELARRLPATMVAASHDAGAREQAQSLLTTSWLRVYTNDDVTGVEIAGAVKNVIALAAGIVDGLRLGYNAKSALLARGLAEIARLGIRLGAKPETFFGVAGVGDLATTCFCPEGRNRTCGERLGRGESLEHVLANTTSIIEGVETTRAVSALAARMGVEMPITEAVRRILFEGFRPAAAIQFLMERELKAERVG